MEAKKLIVLSYMVVATIVVTLIGNAATDHRNKPQVLDFDQFDSLCIADNIPRDLNTWEKIDIYDDDVEKVVTVFIYKSDSISYKVTFGDNGDFNVIKNE